ncbi:hypothetical protein Tco_1326319, partial [Tanacetum coccineum]
KKKQPAKGLETLSEIALSETEQMKLAIERSKTQLHSSQPSGSGAHEGTSVTLGVPDVPKYGSDDEQLSWKSSDEEDDEANVGKDEDDDDHDNDDDRTESDNDGEDFVHLKFSTHDDEARQEEVNKEDSFDPRVQTPSHVESTDDDNSDEEVQGANTEEEEMVEEATHKEDEANELYKDMNVNLEGRDTVMTDALLPNVQATQETEDTHVILTALITPEGQQQSSSVSSDFISNMLNPRLDIGIDSIFTLSTKATSLVDVPITTITEPPLVSATTLPPPPTPLITHMQQTPVPTPTTVPSTSLQDLPNFGSLFGFDHKLKTLETDFSEFKQTNQFAEVFSSIPSIVDAYLANKMNEAIKIAVQLQSNRLRDEAQAENEDFLNKLDDNIKKIIRNQVKEHVKAQVSKILLKIEKTVNEQEAEIMTRSSTESKTSLALAANLSELELKKILIEKMEGNKSIHRSNEQKNLYKALVEAYESDKLILDTYGDTVSFKRRRDDEAKDEEPSTPKSTDKSTEGSKSPRKSAHAEDPIHTTKDLEEPAHQEFKTVQPWLSNLAREEGPCESFDELMDTPLDFSAFMMNRLKVDTLTPELLAGTCKSLIELEYFFKEVYKETTDQLDWNNPEGHQYPHDLRKPLPLIPNSRGRQVIPFDHFINNDLAYLSGGVSSRTYATSVTKTKAANYGHIKWIEDLVPNTMWSEVPVNYKKYALWGISHWGRKRQQFYEYAANRESARDVYYKRRIIAEGDFKRLRLQDIEDMLIILTQGKLTNLNIEDRLAFGVSLRMFTRSIVIQRRVEDLQLGVESYQNKINIIKPDTYISDLKRRDAYTVYSNPRGFIYQNKDKKNKLMCIDELHKFSDGTLDDV